MSDNEEAAMLDNDDTTTLDVIRVALKPRCNLMASIKEFRMNAYVGKVELDVHKHWLRDANEEEVWALFDSLRLAPNLYSLTFRSKGDAVQSLPVSHLTHLLGEAVGLEEFCSEHIKWKGTAQEFAVLANTLGGHTGLRSWQLRVESIDVWLGTIAAAGKVPTLEQVELQSTDAATDRAGLTAALQSLCARPSLRSLRLLDVGAHRFEILSGMARRIGANRTLRQLFLQATELDLNGGVAMAEMLATNSSLTSFILKLDKMHANKLADAFVQALESNDTIQYFQIILDGRMSDMKVVREMQLHFRDHLRAKYNVSSQVGLSMGVIVEKPE